MVHAQHKLALVIATKDRPADLRRALSSLAAQSRSLSQVVIVDASGESVEPVVAEFPTLNPRYVRHFLPSATEQRNVGVLAVEEGIDLIGFLDDDAVLETDAVERMLNFWEHVGGDLGGASFNMMNPPATSGQLLKRSRFCETIGLYRRSTGKVAPSGWHTVIETVNNTRFVDWLTTCAVVWRRGVLEQFHLDDFFAGYSYLEDLDFSLTVGKHYRLAVVADARYYHYPSTGGRVSSYAFGKTEVRNRLYLVRKHGLSLWRCLLGLGIRMAMTFAGAVRRADARSFQRFCGNLAGMLGMGS